MKTFTKFVMYAAALLLPLTAFADGETTSTITIDENSTDVSTITEGYYAIKAKVKGTTGFIYHNSSLSNRAFLQTTSDDASVLTDTIYVWYITQTDNGLVIQNAETGAYIPLDAAQNQNFQGSTAISNAAILNYDGGTDYIDATYKFNDNAVVLWEIQKEYTSGSKSFIYANQVSLNNLSYWPGGKISSNDAAMAQFAFFKLSDTSFSSEKVTKSYAIKVTGTDGTASYSVETDGQDIENGANYVTEWKTSEEASYWYNSPVYSFTVSDETKTVSIENASFTVSEQKVSYTEGDAPFEYYTESNPVLYTIKFRNNDAKYLVHQATTDNNMSTGYTFANIANENYTKFKGALWGFVKDGYGVKLLCYQTGTYVTLANGNNETQATLSANGTTFIALTNTTGSFTLKVKGVDHSVIGDHVNSTLGVWNADISKIQNDGGSNFGITKVDTDILAIGLKAMQAGVKSDYTWTNDTYLTMDASQVLEAVNNASTPTNLTNLETLESTVESKSSTLYISDPGDGYYKLSCMAIGTSANKYATSEAIKVATDGSLLTAYNNDNSMDRQVYRTSASGALVPMLWKLVKYSDNNYYICNVNLDAYMSNGSGSKADFPTQKGYAPTFMLENHATGAKSNYDRSTMFLLHSGDYYINAYGGDNTNYLQHYINEDNGGLAYPTDNGNYWQLEKVTTIPVSIKDIGFASVCFPFAVTIPEGITAFYATEAKDGKLYLTSFDNGVIPANTGAIVKGTNGETYNFDITTTEETNPSGNKLQGATAKRSGFETEKTYGLGNNSGKAAFMLNSLTLIPANKAYMNSDDVTTTSGSTESVSAFDFTYGGVVDAIENATLKPAADKEVYYDLQGHRVLYPTTGIYVTASGQKVLIK